LREADRTGGLAPENWQPPQPLLRPPPESVEELRGAGGQSAEWLIRPLMPMIPNTKPPRGRRA
jgi:hypothetical protein